MGIAVDDSAVVWKDQSSVITVPPFHFWDKFLRSLAYLDNNGIKEEEKRRHESKQCLPVMNSVYPSESLSKHK